MITDCAADCGKKVTARPDGKAYLCHACWQRLFATLFHIIRPAKTPAGATVYVFTEGAGEKEEGRVA